jgi:membrane protein YdbS with pleckstrin-like domain
VTSADLDAAVRAHRHLRRYVLTGERVAVATRLHWARLLEPILTTVVATAVIAWLHALSDVGWVWVLWLVAAGRLAYRWAEWNYEWFVATDKRLVLTYGFIIHKVAMMPLVKVTDMGYSRTPVGQLLGFGRFTMESAGQDQALRQIDYVPDPDRTYRTLCDTMFFKPTTPDQRRQPPALVPVDDNRPITAELPVVDTAEKAGRPGAQRPGGTDGTGGTGSHGEHDPGSTGSKRPVRRRPTWAPVRRPSPYDPPTSGGAGSHVPDPFL